MTQAPTKNSNYLSHYQALESSIEANGQPWVRQLRQRGWSSFAQLGFPTARRGNERWKYTNVAPIANATFEYPVGPTPNAGVELAQLRQVAPWDDQWTNLVKHRLNRDTFLKRYEATKTPPGETGPPAAGAVHLDNPAAYEDVDPESDFLPALVSGTLEM